MQYSDKLYGLSRHDGNITYSPVVQVAILLMFG